MGFGRAEKPIESPILSLNPHHFNMRVLVTGCTGYIAAHCTRLALLAGCQVRGTVRQKTASKTGFLSDLPGASDRLELVEADLLAPDAVWDAAVAGCRYILHVASPFPAAQPSDENELIKPAVEGTLAVLKAAARWNAKAAEAERIIHVVVTSSVASISNGWGTDGENRVWTDDDWSKIDNPSDPIAAYPKSKTLAEKAAWDFHKGLKPEESFELSVVNPGFVLGPMLSTAQCTSAELVQRLMHRTMPAVPDLYFSAVDVRDVALAHIKAMIEPDAAGQRYQSISFTMKLRDCTRVLASKFGGLGYSVPTGNLPGFLLRLIGLWDPTIRQVANTVGKISKHNTDKFKALLGRPTIPWEKTMEDMTVCFLW